MPVLAFCIVHQNAVAQESGRQIGRDSLESPAPPSDSVGGEGDINLYPKRVVLDSRRQITTIGLFNNTAETGTYEISVVDLVMDSTGQIRPVEKVADADLKARTRTASSFLKHSPRRVVLQGAESQLVRVLVRAPADLPDGEYRSHFKVTAIPRNLDEGTSIEQVSQFAQQSDIGVAIRPRFGISIPVIVRIGETTLNVGISDVRLVTTNSDQRAISFNINRAGTRSAFGDILITSNSNGETLALVKGIGVYPEIDSRHVTIPLDPATDPALVAEGAGVTITYLDDDHEPGNILARVGAELR